MRTLNSWRVDAGLADAGPANFAREDAGLADAGPANFAREDAVPADLELANLMDLMNFNSADLRFHMLYFIQMAVY